MAVIGFNRVLSWADYTVVQGSIPGKPRAGATTASGFRANPGWVVDRTPDKKFVIKPSTLLVTVEMDPGQSFVIAGRQTARMLQHEQGHYDISAIAARQFLDDALKVEADTVKELKDTANSVF